MIRARRCPLERKRTRDGTGGDLLGDEASSEAGCSLVSAWVSEIESERESEWYVKGSRSRIGQREGGEDTPP